MMPYISRKHVQSTQVTDYSKKRVFSSYFLLATQTTLDQQQIECVHTMMNDDDEGGLGLVWSFVVDLLQGFPFYLYRFSNSGGVEEK